jgi:hypothetical protein
MFTYLARWARDFHIDGIRILTMWRAWLSSGPGRALSALTTPILFTWTSLPANEFSSGNGADHAMILSWLWPISLTLSLQTLAVLAPNIGYRTGRRLRRDGNGAKSRKSDLFRRNMPAVSRSFPGRRKFTPWPPRVNGFSIYIPAIKTNIPQWQLPKNGTLLAGVAMRSYRLT